MSIKNNATRIALKWAMILFVGGSVIIFGSDFLLEKLIDDLSTYRTYQTYKGIGFFGLISLVLFFTLRNLLQTVKREQLEIEIERRFSERIQNSIPGIFYVLDKEGRLLRWNENTNIISGLSDKELKHLNVLERIEPIDKEKAEAALQEVEEEGETETELHLKTRAASKRLYKITASRFQDDGHQFIVGTGIDITEQVKANDKIKRQNYQLKTAQEIAQLGYWETDLETGRLKWSNIVYELFGLNPENFKPTIDAFYELIHPDDRITHQDRVREFMEKGSFESEYRIIKPTGEIGWFRELGEIYEWKDGKPLILHGVVLDITEQKNQEKKTKKSYLEGENKERQRISNELHDGIAQYLSAALLHIDNAEEILENKKGASLLRNARELLQRSLLETRAIAQNLMPQTIDRHGVISAVKLMIKQYELSSDFDFHFKKNITQEFTIDKEIEMNVYRIVQEAISNAVRHSGGNTIWVEILKDSHQLSCKIEDNGQGFKESEISKKRGQGLQSIKDRVEMLSGSIEIKTAPEKGLSISVKIPINKDRENE